MAMEALPDLQQVEIIRLAKDIPHLNYSEFCVALGYSMTEGQNILASHKNEFKEATTQVLNEWNTKQTKPSLSRSILATKLKDAELGGLGVNLSRGKYLQSQDELSNQEAVPSDSDIYNEKISESLTVRKCRSILEDRYSNQLCKIQMKPWDKNDYTEFEEMHTVVTIVKKDSRGDDIKEKEILQGSVGKIFATKVNGKFPSRILVSAPAGRGKTTAVAKMAHDWVHKERGSGLEDLPLLFVVKFRNTTQRTSIGEAIISQLLSDVRDLTPEGLESFIREHQGICHIVLDGLDEYAGISSKSNILSILQWKMFRQCRVLVTTRPHLEDFFIQGDLPKVYTKMGIEGFSRESSHDYIDKFFTSINKPMSCKSADGLKVYLDEQPLIEELVKTPLFCLMVCHLWSEDLLQSETTTQTALLDKVNLFLMHHANARSPGLIESLENLTDIILKLGEVALTGLLNDSKKLVFTSHDFQRIPSILHMACALGIVSKAVVSRGCIPQTSETSQTTIDFYHKLAQEHAAGKFLAHETNRFMLAFKISKIDRVLRKINSNIGEYENLIRFAAGTKNSLCVRIMEKLLTNSHLSESERYRILLDCSSESGVNVVNVSSLIRRCVTAHTMILKSPTIYTAVGMRNLPNELKQKVAHVQFEDSILTTAVTDGLWSCLKLFPELRVLTISNSSLVFPSSPPELPSVTRVLAKKMTSQCYKCLISSLPGLRDIDVQDAARYDFADFLKFSTCLTSLERLQITTLDEWHFDFDIAKGVQITKCHLSSEMTVRIWSCLRSFTSLNHLTISDSSLSFSLSHPELPSVTKLLANKLTSQCYQGLISSLTGLRDIKVRNAARDDFVEFVESSIRLTSLQRLEIKTLDRWQFDFDTAKGVQITKCHLSSEMTVRMWSCLRPFTSLNHLTISDSSLSFSFSPPELPSVRKLLANKLTSQCYQGLISSLPGLRGIDVQNATTDDFVEFVKSSIRLTSLQRLEIKTLDRWQFGFDTAKGLQITKCHLSSEMTVRMWSCLRPLTSLKHLTISESSLSFSLSPPELPSVTKLLANKLTSQCYQGLISSLPGLRDIEVQNAATDDFVEFVESSTRLTSLQGIKIKDLDKWQFDFDNSLGAKITKCRLSSEMTSRMWPCLRSFNSLKHLTISDSSLSFPPSPPELPSVTQLSVKGVTSQSYNGLISSLPGLEGIDITMDDEEGDIARYIVVLRRTAGQKLKHIYLCGPSSWSSLLRNRGRVSRKAITGLGMFIEERTKNLVSLYLECVECTDENCLVYLIECCRRVKTMKRVELVKCGTISNGRLQYHLKQLHCETSDGLDVTVFHDDIGNDRYFIPHFISWSHKT